MANATIHPVVVARAQSNAQIWDETHSSLRDLTLFIARRETTHLPAPEARKYMRVELRSYGCEPKLARALAAHAVRATR